MLAVTEARTSAFEVPLSQTDAAAIERVAWRLCKRVPARLDEPGWVNAARHAWHELPTVLRRVVAEFRRNSGPHGSLLLRGLPVGEDSLPLTPTVKGSVQRTATVPASVLMMTACGLGDPAAFRAEKSGALVQDVVPVPGMEEFQGNAGSTLLSFHNENAFHPHRPDFVMLLCLRADPEALAGLRVACVRQLRALLPPYVREALFAPEFVTAPPPSFGLNDREAPPHPVLSGDPDDPDLRVDLAATAPTTRRAGEALLVLQELFDRTARTVRLVPGDLAIVDNRIAVHGRTAFTPRYNGYDRWLQRTFVLTDLRRSRNSRPQDGYVLSETPAAVPGLVGAASA